MNDELSDDIKKKFMLPLTIELHDHREKVFHNSPVSPKYNQILGSLTLICFRHVRYLKVTLDCIPFDNF